MAATGSGSSGQQKNRVSQQIALSVSIQTTVGGTGNLGRTPSHLATRTEESGADGRKLLQKPTLAVKKQRSRSPGNHRSRQE
jgi:hypothetical protein